MSYLCGDLISTRNIGGAAIVPSPPMEDPALLDHIGHILIIDDEDDCNFVTKLVLKKAGFKGDLTCFTSPGDAIQFLRTRERSPDLMFVDINMPGMNGFELLTLAETEELLPNGKTSVVMFSSSNRPSDLERALTYRSVIGYVEKALTLENFERVVADHHRQMKR